MSITGPISGFGWEHFHHDSDIGVCGRGRSVAEAFEQAALGLTRIVTYSPIVAVMQVEVKCRQTDWNCSSWTGSTPSSTRWRSYGFIHLGGTRRRTGGAGFKPRNKSLPRTKPLADCHFA
ncbi:archease [Sinorhizobium terangae]